MKSHSRARKFLSFFLTIISLSIACLMIGADFASFQSFSANPQSFTLPIRKDLLKILATFGRKQIKEPPISSSMKGFEDSFKSQLRSYRAVSISS